MFTRLRQFISVKTRSKAVLAGVVAAAGLALVAGWAAAASGPGQSRAGGTSLTSARLNSHPAARSSVGGSAPQALGPQAAPQKGSTGTNLALANGGFATGRSLRANPASANPAQKVPLIHFATAFCNSGSTTSTPTGNGFAVIKREGGNLSTEISLKQGLPNTTYHVRLIQTPGGADCLVFDTTLTTNGQGNGNVHFSEALMSGTTDAFVDLSSMGIAGDFYNTPDVTLG